MSLLTSQAIFTGTQINYFVICKTKLWYFSHFLQQEHESDLVALGKMLQETAYEGTKKDIIIDSKVAIDFIRKGDKLILHEVKKSNKLEKAHVLQLVYYIYYLKNEKGIKNVEGRINYPNQRKVVEVRLSKEKEDELLKIFKEINRIVSLPRPPKPERKRYCRKCSYFEFCWC